MSNTTNKKVLIKNTEIDVLKIKTERNNLGVLKTLLVVFLIALQATVFFMSYIYFVSFIRWFAVFSLIMSIITCIYVLSSNKNSQSKPVWILFLLLCFSFGYIIYFISDDRIFWRKHRKRYTKILERSYKYQAKPANVETNQQVQNDCKYLYDVASFSGYTNTECKYFSSGATLFDSIIQDLQQAKKFIFIEFFIISDGVLLNRLLSVLEERVKNGVDVRIIYDDLGSHGTFKRRTKQRIKKCGIKLKSFNKLLPQFSALLNYRDHRKIVIIDGQVSYTGGANLADEYINEKRLHGYWKDAGIRFNGSAVDGFTLMFLRQWEFVSKINEDYDKYLCQYKPAKNSSIVVPYADGLEYEANVGKNAYTNMIANANEKLYIMSPYFVIDDTIRNLLINKARSGVDIRIILPEIADKKFVYIISRNNAEVLSEHGIKVYTMNHSFVHSKIMLNEHSAIIGSINMDLRSFYQQFESAVYLNDENVLKSVEQDFKSTFENSTLITKQNMKRNRLYFRIMAGITNIISPFM